MDDNPDIRRSLKLYLENWGMPCYRSRGEVKRAIDLLKNRADRGEEHFDLCISDQMMPDMDGWQLASEGPVQSGSGGYQDDPDVL